MHKESIIVIGQIVPHLLNNASPHCFKDTKVWVYKLLTKTLFIMIVMLHKDIKTNFEMVVLHSNVTMDV